MIPPMLALLKFPLEAPSKSNFQFGCVGASLASVRVGVQEISGFDSHVCYLLSIFDFLKFCLI
jgi:hypothetical protein